MGNKISRNAIAPLPDTAQDKAKAAESLDDGVTFDHVTALIASLGLSKQLPQKKLKHLFAFFDADESSAIDPTELKDGVQLLQWIVTLVTQEPPAAPAAAPHKSEVDAAQLPPGLRAFTPVSKTPEVQARIKEGAHLEDSVCEAPTDAAALDALRQHTEGVLRPAIEAAIVSQTRTEGILTTCDEAIAAGQGFDNFYTSTFDDTIKPGEADGLKRLAGEVKKTQLPPADKCVQGISEPIALYADAARVRHKARAAMEAIAAQAAGVRLEPQGRLKSLGRIVEKAAFRPVEVRDKCERVCDIVRDMFVAEKGMEAIASLVGALRESKEIELVRIKDRFTTPSVGGWRDLMINYRLAGDAHVCELQICHASLLVARAGLPGHAIYGRLRNATELLERLGMIDPRTHRLNKAVGGAGYPSVIHAARLRKVGGMGVADVLRLRPSLMPVDLLADFGYALAEVREGGVTSEQVADAVRAELASGGKRLSALRQQGVASFQSLGFDTLGLMQLGFTVPELLLAGVPREELASKHFGGELGGHASPISDIVLLDGGRMASTDEHGVIRVWDATGAFLHATPTKCFTVEEQLKNRPAGKCVGATCSLSDGRYAASSHAQIYVWHGSGERYSYVPHSILHGGKSKPNNQQIMGSNTISTYSFKDEPEKMSKVTGLCPLGDGRHMVACDDAGRFHIWDTLAVDEKEYEQAKGKGGVLKLKTVQGVKGCARHGMCLLADGHGAVGGSTLVAVAGDDALRVYDLESGTCTQTLKGHTRKLRCMCVIGDVDAKGRRLLVSASEDDTVRLWDADSGECVRELMKVKSGAGTNAVCSLGNGRLAVGGGSMLKSEHTFLRIVDVETGECLKELEGGHTAEVLALCWLGNGKLVSGSRDQKLCVWDV